MDEHIASKDPDTGVIHRALVKCDDLSIREREVFDLLGVGKSNRQIANGLRISEATVRAHVSSILIKLGVESRLQAGLVRQMERWGILPIEPRPQ
jgi:DNA-binding NarL/FixJ family response regulator